MGLGAEGGGFAAGVGIIGHARRFTPGGMARGRSGAVGVAIAIAAAVIAAAALTVGWSFYLARPADEPQAWQRAESKNKVISLEVPGNWKFTTAGSAGSNETVVVRSRLARLEIRGSQGVGALADASGAARASADPSAKVRFLKGLHRKLGELVQARDSSFGESEEYRIFELAGLAAVYSEYKALRRAGILAVPVKGWRITVPVRDFAYIILFEAPERDFDRLQKTAQRMLVSLRFSG